MSFPFFRFVEPYAGIRSEALNRFVSLPSDLLSAFFTEENAPKEPHGLETSSRFSQDLDSLLYFKESVIGGYLNLGEADGWREGHDPRLGFSFTHHILSEYLSQKQGRLGRNAVVFEKTARAFTSCEALSWSPHPEKNENAFHPTESRICVDSSVLGWQKHVICRLVGNLGSTYDPSKPFFEVLVNSARTSAEEALCQPFFISIHANESEMEKRRCLLQSLRQVPPELAHFSFYPSYLIKPEAFLKMYKEKLGPNSTRLLNSLIFLQEATLYAQKVGNCWVKQPMRCLLTTLYVELITHRLDLTPAEAWKEAIRLYKDIQQTVAIPFMEKLIDQSAITSEMKKTALLALERQKTL